MNYLYEKQTEELRQVVGEIVVEEYSRSMSPVSVGHKTKRRQRVVVKIQRKWLVSPGVYPREVGPPDIEWREAIAEWRDLPSVTESEARS